MGMNLGSHVVGILSRIGELISAESTGCRSAFALDPAGSDGSFTGARTTQQLWSAPQGKLGNTGATAAS